MTYPEKDNEGFIKIANCKISSKGHADDVNIGVNEEGLSRIEIIKGNFEYIVIEEVG